MIVDTSVIVAILRNEPEADAFLATMRSANRVCIASPTYLECCLVLTKDRSEESVLEIDNLLSRIGIEIVPFTVEMAKIASGAFLAYGKGRKHKAQLNFGDCISYSISKCEAMPLLFKGDDFRHTDVECVK